jgi:hypothetical protein
MTKTTGEQSIYWVEVDEGENGNKIVPHTRDEKNNEGFYRFMSRSDAKKFRDELIRNNPDYSFRLVKFTEKYSFEKFYSKNDLEK